MQKFEKGDEIAIVSLSSGILGEISKEQLNFGINAMKNLGFTLYLCLIVWKALNLLKIIQKLGLMI